MDGEIFPMTPYQEGQKYDNKYNEQKRKKSLLAHVWMVDFPGTISRGTKI